MAVKIFLTYFCVFDLVSLPLPLVITYSLFLGVLVVFHCEAPSMLWLEKVSVMHMRLALP